jgi:surface antigen
MDATTIAAGLQRSDRCRGESAHERAREHTYNASNGAWRGQHGRE